MDTKGLQMTVIRIGALIMKVKVSLGSKTDKGEEVPFYQEKNGYGTFNYTQYITIEPIMTTDWHKDKIVTMLYSDYISFKRMIKNTYEVVKRNEDCYVINEDNIMFANTEKYTARLVTRFNSNIAVGPVVLKRNDEKGNMVQFKGWMITFGKMGATVTLDNFDYESLIMLMEEISMADQINTMVTNFVTMKANTSKKVADSMIVKKKITWDNPAPPEESKVIKGNVQATSSVGDAFNSLGNMSK